MISFCCLPRTGAVDLPTFTYKEHFITTADSQNSKSLYCFRSNININDALGDYSLTLVDALDTLAVSLVE